MTAHRLVKSCGLVFVLTAALALGACSSDRFLDNATARLTAHVSSPSVTRDMLAAGTVPTLHSHDKPRLVKTAERISCVPYARNRSGIALRGNARLWWKKAKGLYAELKSPADGAVMVFSRGKRLRRGHLAVVTRIVSSREIRVDHANWPGGGKVYLNVPVYDVSAKNDWSKVRVYDVPSGQPGVHVYPVSGFIAKPVRTAQNDAG